LQEFATRHEEVAFIIRRTGKVEEKLVAITENLKLKLRNYLLQNEALGTGHASICAQGFIDGPASYRLR
jgi:UTP-glucose-1-phosphate uridylyltransferase